MGDRGAEQFRRGDPSDSYDPFQILDAPAPQKVIGDSIDAAAQIGAKERHATTLTPDMALAGTIVNLKKKYPAVAEKYPTLFDGALYWDLRYSADRAGHEVIENHQDVDDFAALSAIDAQVESHEQELEALALKILERKGGKKSLTEKFKELLPDWLS